MKTRTHDQEGAATFNEDRHDFGGQAVEFRVKLAAGDRWLSVAIPRVFEGLPPRYGGPESLDASGSRRESSSRRPAPRPNGIALFRKRFDDAQAELDRRSR